MDIQKFDLSEYDPNLPTEHYMNEPIVKSCEAKYNLARGWNIIRLGTSEGFKEDKSESGDPLEGAASFSWDFRTPIAAGWDNHVIMPNLPNIYMFCTSLSDQILFGKNDDKYYITNPRRFAQLLANELVKQLNPHDFEIDQAPGLSIYPPYQAVGFIEKVRYSKIFHHNNTNLSAQEIAFNASFRKPKSYENEKEVRIAFQVSNSGARHVLRTKKAAKYVDISAVRHEINELVSLTPPEGVRMP